MAILHCAGNWALVWRLNAGPATGRWTGNGALVRRLNAGPAAATGLVTGRWSGD